MICVSGYLSNGSKKRKNKGRIKFNEYNFMHGASLCCHRQNEPFYWRRIGTSPLSIVCCSGIVWSLKKDEIGFIQLNMISLKLRCSRPYFIVVINMCESFLAIDRLSKLLQVVFLSASNGYEWVISSLSNWILNFLCYFSNDFYVIAFWAEGKVKTPLVG